MKITHHTATHTCCGCDLGAAIAPTTVLDLYWRERDISQRFPAHAVILQNMKLTTVIFVCAAASIHALTAPPQLSELKSNLKLKLRKQQLLRATASQNVTTPRRYASRAELKDALVTELQPNPFHWTEWPFRIGSLGAFYVSYPLAWQAVQALPSA